MSTLPSCFEYHLSVNNTLFKSFKLREYSWAVEPSFLAKLERELN